ncbi:MAG TPA: biopolymer transporter ExbD [Acidobacteriota bacterium]|nr:biopolymer transporter ExbD [Acidobacteriota bacterium]
MAFSSGRKFGSALADINVTPLVDVVLVLLIIFMVTAPLMHRGIDVDLPRTATQTSENEERLIVSLDKKGMIYIDDIQIPMADLKEQIQKRVPSLKNKNAIFLRADRTLQYGIIMEVMDEIKSAGVPTVGLVTEAQKKTK